MADPVTGRYESKNCGYELQVTRRSTCPRVRIATTATTTPPTVVTHARTRTPTAKPARSSPSTPERSSSHVTAHDSACRSGDTQQRSRRVSAALLRCAKSSSRDGRTRVPKFDVGATFRRRGGAAEAPLRSGRERSSRIGVVGGRAGGDAGRLSPPRRERTRAQRPRARRG